MVLEAGGLGETYNIGGHNEKTNLEVVHAICGLLDELRPDSPHAPARVPDHLRHGPPRPRPPLRDRRRARSAASWAGRPREDFASGLRKTVQWYLANASWCASAGAYQGERLGLGRAAG